MGREREGSGSNCAGGRKLAQCRHQILSPKIQPALPPYSPWTNANYRTGVDPRRPIGHQGAYLEVREQRPNPLMRPNDCVLPHHSMQHVPPWHDCIKDGGQGEDCAIICLVYWKQGSELCSILSMYAKCSPVKPLFRP